jgi:predicted secreted protein
MALLLMLLATLTLTPADNGRSFSVAPGTPIVVELASNASTGYRWRLATRPDEAVVTLISHRYLAPRTKRPGAAGKEVWRFRAVGAGVARLRLSYAGPTRPPRIARRFSVAIRVR